MRRVRRQTRQHLTQVRKHVDAQALAACREVEANRGRPTARVAADKRSVGAADTEQLQRSLTDVVVDVLVAIRRVVRNGYPLVEHVVHGQGDRALGCTLGFWASSQLTSRRDGDHRGGRKPVVSLRGAGNAVAVLLFLSVAP